MKVAGPPVWSKVTEQDAVVDEQTGVGAGNGSAEAGVAAMATSPPTVNDVETTSAGRRKDDELSTGSSKGHLGFPRRATRRTSSTGT
ncbi:hypothetical protein ASD81_13035 [Nocardioides sp. Root614]|nr:hypothetical protein ASD81_13035 [Nocardioides sp. Root614]KRA89135.1 hypothetical protein ASD84_13300 [Nocardioides sp. Root682]